MSVGFGVLKLGSARVDLGRSEVRVGSAPPVALTELEARALARLADHRGRTVTREQLLTEVWGYAATVRTRAVDHTFSRLRRKVGDGWITSTRGGGYRLEREPRAAPPLPPDPTPLVGRGEELARIGVLLAAHPVVQIVGLGGVGKSRLALAFARGWEAGVDREAVFVNLAGAKDAVERIAVGAGLRSGNLADLDGRTELVIVADEVEGVDDEALLAAFEGLNGPRVLVTSQRPLPFVAGEATLPLPPLPPDDAAALVCARSPVALDPDSARVVAAAVDGIPLAIELCVGWLGVGEVSDVVARVGRLVGGAPPVAATLGRAWEVLDPRARALLGYACAFAGSFDAEGLAAVAGVSIEAAREGLDVLRASGWVQSHGPRFVVLHLVAGDVAARGGVPADATDRHCAWIVALAPPAFEAIRARWDEALERRIVACEPDARKALRTEVTDPVHAGQLLRIVLRDDRIPLSVALADVAAAEAVGADPALVAGFRGMLYNAHGRPHEAQPYLEAAVRGCTGYELGWVRCGLAGNLRMMGQPDACPPLLAEALRDFEVHGSVGGLGYVRSIWMNHLYTTGAYAAARVMADEAVEAHTAYGSPRGLGRTHLGHAWGLWRAGDRAEAEAQIDLAEDLLREVGDGIALSALLGLRATWASDRGQFAVARAAAAECRAWSSALGDLRMVVLQDLTVARVEIETGAAASGLELALATLPRVEASGYLGGIRRARFTAAMAHLWLGRPELARAILEPALDPGRAAPDVDDDFHAACVLARLGTADREGANALAGLVSGRAGEIVRAALARGADVHARGALAPTPTDSSEARLLLGAASADRRHGIV